MRKVLAAFCSLSLCLITSAAAQQPAAVPVPPPAATTIEIAALTPDQDGQLTAWMSGMDKWQKYDEKWRNRPVHDYWERVVERKPPPAPPAWLPAHCRSIEAAGMTGFDATVDHACRLVEDPRARANQQSITAAPPDVPRHSSFLTRVHIDGLIRSDSDRTQALERLENSQAAAVIVHINSPGGTTAGSEQLYDSLVRLKAKKPLVVMVEGLAASGGYITAIASDHIIAQQSSLVGSIGVLFQYPNVTELLKTIGVKVEEVKSSPLKAAPNGFEPTSPEARAALDALVRDSYAWFKGLVKERRGMDDTQLEKVADGRVFTGRQAIDLKLIDQIGDEKTAVTWLVEQKGVKKGLSVRDYKLQTRFGDLPFLKTAAAVTLEALGLGSIAHQIGQTGVTQAVDRFGMDGMLALWQPAASN